MAKPTFATFGAGKILSGIGACVCEFGETNAGDFNFLILDDSATILAQIEFPGPIDSGSRLIKVAWQPLLDNSAIRVTPTMDGEEGVDTVTDLAYVDIPIPFAFPNAATAARFGSLFVAINNPHKVFVNIKCGTTDGATDLFDGFSAASVIPPFSGAIKNGTTVSASLVATMESGLLDVHPSGICTGYIQKNFP